MDDKIGSWFIRLQDKVRCIALWTVFFGYKLHILHTFAFSIQAATVGVKCPPVLSLVPLVGCPVDKWLYKPH